MTPTTRRFFSALIAGAVAVTASSALAQGGGDQWTELSETESLGEAAPTDEAVKGLSANAHYLTQAGETRDGAVATAKPGKVIAVHPNAYDAAQNGDATDPRDDAWQFADVY